MAPTISILLLLSLSFFLLLSFLYLFRRRHRTNKKKHEEKPNLPPGPRRLPIIGNLHQVGFLAHRSLHRYSKLHGPIMHIRLGLAPAVVISSPDLARELLKTHDLSSCSRPPIVTFHEYSYRGSDVAAAPYGENWRNLRKIFILQLLNTKKINTFRSHREDETYRMIHSIPSSSNSSSCAIVNISELTLRLSNNIVNRAAFGYKSEGEYGEKSRFHEILKETNAVLAAFCAEDCFPGFGWVDVLTGQRRRMKKNAKEMDDFYEEVIRDHLSKNSRKEGCEEEEEEDIVDVLIRLWKGGEEKLTLDNIKGALMVCMWHTNISCSLISALFFFE